MDMKQFAAISAINARVAALQVELAAMESVNAKAKILNTLPGCKWEDFAKIRDQLSAYAQELSEMHGDYTHDDIPVAEAIASRPHVVAKHDGQEYEILVVCDCGCKESVPFARPDCSAECGRYMRPVRVTTFEEARG